MDAVRLGPVVVGQGPAGHFPLGRLFDNLQRVPQVLETFLGQRLPGLGPVELFQVRVVIIVPDSLAAQLGDDGKASGSVIGLRIVGVASVIINAHGRGEGKDSRGAVWPSRQ